MLDKYYVRPDTADRVRSSWIGSAVEKYVHWLSECRYSSRSILRRIPVLVRFGEFAQKRGATQWEHLPDHVESFIQNWISERTRPKIPSNQRKKICDGVRNPIRQMLRLVVPGYVGLGRSCKPDNPFERDAPRFFEYLKEEKGLRARSIASYRHYLRRFAAYLERIGLEELSHLSPTVLSGFVAEYSRRVGWCSLRNACGSLRVFLRYLHREGVLPKDLSHVIESPQSFRLSGIPRSIAWNQVQRVLESVDRRTPIGKRDYAILLLLVTYGLRAREVAALTLDDINWRNDRLRVPERKAGHSTAYPLSPIVGEAILDYLKKGRPGRRGGSPMKSLWIGFQSILANDIRNFLAHKRALGRRYDVEEVSLRLLDRYLAQQSVKGPSDVTADLIEKFLASRPRQRPRSYNHLLCTVRRLFDWLVGQEVLQSSPVRTKPRRQTSQRIPFIFDLQTARRLLEVAQRLPERSKAPMRGKTYHAIFAILYGLGLRVGEACRLQLKDVDFDRRLLVIRQTKFYKSRLVPFGPKMEALLLEHLRAMGRRFGALSPDAPFFSFTNRGEIHPCTVSQTFHHLIPQLRLVIPPGGSSPRLHDLRHSFAVGTLIRWYRTGADPGAGLLKLATFLGHVDVNSTAVYLTMTETLLQEANSRFEPFVAPIIREGLRR